jgi:hypothetical protein
VQLDLVVESDPGVRLADVPVRIDGKLVGRTGPRGAVRATVLQPRGSLLRIGHDCPVGHEGPPDDEQIRLRGYHSDGISTDVEIRLKCRPVDRVAAFVIRAINAPGVPVLLNGRIVAQTNDAGVLHFVRRAPPGTEHLVELDARSRPELLPRGASRFFTQPDADELFVIDRMFQKTETRRKASSRRRRIIKIE